MILSVFNDCGYIRIFVSRSGVVAGRVRLAEGVFLAFDCPGVPFRPVAVLVIIVISAWRRPRIFSGKK